ncbi:MAG: right-handed parallel beta-helix repeat-containing protein [Pseudomonadota bacterium]
MKATIKLHSIKQIKLFFVLTLFAILTVLIMLSPSWAATYYVNASNGNNNNDGLSPSTAWKTIAKVNSSNFQPGDYILFKRGEIWREQLIVRSSGNSGNPISFEAYGSGDKPVINGTDLISGWISLQPNVWKATYSKQPIQVFFDGVRGKKESSISTLNSENVWYWESNILYVYNTSGPPTLYTSPGVEADRDQNGIEIFGQDWIVIKDIHAYAGRHGFLVGYDSDNITIDSVHASYNYRRGIFIYQYFTSDNNCDTGIVKNSEVEWQGGIGISVVGKTPNWTLQNNAVHHTCSLDIDNFWHYQTAGINAFGEDVTNLLVEKNHCYENNPAHLMGPRGAGIWMDTVGDGLIVRMNDVHSNHLVGILIEVTSNAQIYYNISYKNIGEKSCSGLTIIGRPDVVANGNKIYNNVCYGNDPYGIRIDSSGDAYNIISNNIVKNNISVGNTLRNLVARNGGNNDGSRGSSNVYKYNCFGVDSTGFIEWALGNVHNTYDTWEAVYEASNSVRADPRFTNDSNNDYSLQEDSPCIDAGADVGLAQDYLGNSLAGTAWDIGAYEYGKLSPPVNIQIISISNF